MDSLTTRARTLTAFQGATTLERPRKRFSLSAFESGRCRVLARDKYDSNLLVPKFNERVLADGWYRERDNLTSEARRRHCFHLSPVAVFYIKNFGILWWMHVMFVLGSYRTEYKFSPPAPLSGGAGRWWRWLYDLNGWCWHHGIYYDTKFMSCTTEDVEFDGCSFKLAIKDSRECCFLAPAP